MLLRILPFTEDAMAGSSGPFVFNYLLKAVSIGPIPELESLDTFSFEWAGVRDAKASCENVLRSHLVQQRSRLNFDVISPL